MALAAGAIPPLRGTSRICCSGWKCEAALPGHNRRSAMCPSGTRCALTPSPGVFVDPGKRSSKASKVCDMARIGMATSLHDYTQKGPVQRMAATNCKCDASGNSHTCNHATKRCVRLLPSSRMFLRAKRAHWSHQQKTTRNTPAGPISSDPR